MPSPGYTVRIAPDLKQAADEKAADERITTFTAVIDAALNTWLGTDTSAAYREAIRRAEEAEAARDDALQEMDSLRARLARLTGAKAPVAAPVTGASREDRLIAALEASTPRAPVSRRHLTAMSGYEKSVLTDRLAYLRDNGYVTQPSQGWYARVPGADLREGLAGAKVAAAARQQEVRKGTKANGVAPEPSPAPRRAAGGRTEAEKGKSAARERKGAAPAEAPPPVAAQTARAAAAVRQVRDAGHDVTTASQIPAPVFKAGPDVDCTHPSFRGVKGVCPDCKQWVGGKR